MVNKIKSKSRQAHFKWHQHFLRCGGTSLRLNGGSCLFIYRKCRHSSGTLWVCVCVCVDTHLHRDFFFYFDFTLSILSGYLELMKSGILHRWEAGMKKENTQFWQGNNGVHTSSSPEDFSYKTCCPEWPLWAKKHLSMYLSNHFHIHYPDDIKLPLSVLNINYLSILRLLRSTREGEIMSPVLFNQKSSASQRQPSQKCSECRPTRNGKW